MPLVAIAGGTSTGLGRAITTAILNTYPDGKWTPVLLSRGSKVPLWLKAIDPEQSRTRLAQVDYHSHSSLVGALQGVHTILSVTLAKDGTQAQIQINLLNAGIEVGARRFAPSEWACGREAEGMVELVDALKTGVWEACDEAERQGRIEKWAIFSLGSFMNYLGIGRYEMETKSDERLLQEMQKNGGYEEGDDEACAGIEKDGDMPDGKGGYLIDIATRTAQLIVNEHGESAKLTMSEIRDVGRFVAKSLDLDKWERDMGFAGDTVRVSEVIEMIEALIAEKFTVTKYTKEDLEKELASVDPEAAMERLWLQLKLVCLSEKVGAAIIEPTGNKMVPDFKPITVKEYLEKYWGQP